MGLCTEMELFLTGSQPRSVETSENKACLNLTPCCFTASLFNLRPWKEVWWRVGGEIVESSESGSACLLNFILITHTRTFFVHVNKLNHFDLTVLPSRSLRKIWGAESCGRRSFALW